MGIDLTAIRRLVTALEEQGIQVGRYRGRHLMRQAALKPVGKRKFMHTTDSKLNLPIFWIDNLNRIHSILGNLPHSVFERNRAEKTYRCIRNYLTTTLRRFWSPAALTFVSLELS